VHFLEIQRRDWRGDNGIMLSGHPVPNTFPQNNDHLLCFRVILKHVQKLSQPQQRSTHLLQI